MQKFSLTPWTFHIKMKGRAEAVSFYQVKSPQNSAEPIQVASLICSNLRIDQGLFLATVKLIAAAPELISLHSTLLKQVNKLLEHRFGEFDWYGLEAAETRSKEFVQRLKVKDANAAPGPWTYASSANGWTLIVTTAPTFDKGSGTEMVFRIQTSISDSPQVQKRVACLISLAPELMENLVAMLREFANLRAKQNRAMDLTRLGQLAQEGQELSLKFESTERAVAA